MKKRPPRKPLHERYYTQDEVGRCESCSREITLRSNKDGRIERVLWCIDCTTNDRGGYVARAPDGQLMVVVVTGDGSSVGQVRTYPLWRLDDLREAARPAAKA